MDFQNKLNFTSLTWTDRPFNFRIEFCIPELQYFQDVNVKTEGKDYNLLNCSSWYAEGLAWYINVAMARRASLRYMHQIFEFPACPLV